MITVSIDVEDFRDLLDQLKGLTAAFEALEENAVDPLVVAAKLRISRKDMDDILWEYQSEICDGQHVPVQDLIQRHSGELSLYHAPIDTWPAIAAEAAAALEKKRKGIY